MVYSSFSVMLPNVIYIIIMSFIMPTPYALFSMNSFYIIFITLIYMIFFLYGTYISYCGMRVCTGVGKWRARFLFILPNIFIAFVLYVVLGVALLVGNYEEPDIGHPKTYEDDYVSFQYPGNWEVEEYYDIAWEEEWTDEWEDEVKWNEAVDSIQPVKPTPTERVAPWVEQEEAVDWDDWDDEYPDDYIKNIVVIVPDTYTSVDIYIHDASVTFQSKYEEYEEFYENTKENFYLILDRDYDWGVYPGILYYMRYEPPEAGFDEYYIYTDFFGYDNKRVFNVEWSCDYSEYFLTKPGFDLIQNTFRLKDYTLPDVETGDNE
jgi:hypothetical protein